MKVIACIVLSLILLCKYSFGQSDSTIGKVSTFPDKIFKKINSKTSSLDNAISKQTEKYLNRLAKKERKFKKQFYKIDSVSAARFYTNNPERGYNSFIQKIQKDSTVLNPSMGP